MTSLIRIHYDLLAELDCLFDDAFNTRFSPSTSSPGVAHRATAERPDSFRGKGFHHLSVALLLSTSRLDLFESKE